MYIDNMLIFFQKVRYYNDKISTLSTTIQILSIITSMDRETPKAFSETVASKNSPPHDLQGRDFFYRKSVRI